MTGNRKGISFTLTLVVIGVVLLMTALTVIVLGGANIGGFLERGGEAATEGSVEQACNDLARQISNRYCGQYVHNDGSTEERCSRVQRQSSVNYQATASSVRCNYITAANGDETSSAARQLQNVLRNEENTVNPETGEIGYDINGEGGADEWLPIVTVQGTPHDCVAENYLTPTCPVQ